VSDQPQRWRHADIEERDARIATLTHQRDDAVASWKRAGEALEAVTQEKLALASRLGTLEEKYAEACRQIESVTGNLPPPAHARALHPRAPQLRQEVYVFAYWRHQQWNMTRIADGSEPPSSSASIATRTTTARTRSTPATARRRPRGCRATCQNAFAVSPTCASCRSSRRDSGIWPPSTRRGNSLPISATDPRRRTVKPIRCDCGAAMRRDWRPDSLVVARCPKCGARITLEPSNEETAKAFGMEWPPPNEEAGNGR
jgi:hypothetical protein